MSRSFDSSMNKTKHAETAIDMDYKKKKACWGMKNAPR